VIAEIVADEAPELSRRLCRPQSGGHSAIEIEHACLAGEFRASSRREKGDLIVVLITREVRTDLRRGSGNCSPVFVSALKIDRQDRSSAD
jgi:hypothetical protein